MRTESNTEISELFYRFAAYAASKAALNHMLRVDTPSCNHPAVLLIKCSIWRLNSDEKIAILLFWQCIRGM
jgi:hypothetical protein